MTDNAKRYSENDSPERKSSEMSEGLVPFDTTQITSKLNRSNPKPGDPCHPLAAGAHPPAIAFNRQSGNDQLNPQAELVDALHCKQTPAVMRADPQTRTAEQHSLQLTSSAEGSPARISAWPESVLDWMATDPGYGTSSVASLASSLPVGFSSRTSLAFYPAMTDETWQSSFEGWRNSGTGGPTGCLTLNTSEFPRDAVVCSLSDVLETSGPHLTRYFLSARACRGILRRAAKRGKELPTALKLALTGTVDK